MMCYSTRAYVIFHSFDHYESRRRLAHLKLVIVTISSVLLFAALLGVLFGHIPVRSSTRFHSDKRLSISIGIGDLISMICKNTLYPDVCVQDLSSFQISLNQNPLDLVSMALRAAASSANDAYNVAATSFAQQGLDLLESQGANDCMELMDTTKDQLNKVLSRLPSLVSLDLTTLRSSLKDVKVWLSSSLSYQTACSDGFDLAPGSIQQTIQSNQNSLAEIIANGLSFIDILAQIGNDLSSWLLPLPPSPAIPHLRRRLLSDESSVDVNSRHDGIAKEDPFFSIASAVDDGFPEWVSPTDRKLLQTPTSSVNANAVVAQDGSGNYLTITDAVNNIPAGYTGRYVIYIKKGIYAEVFNISTNQENITFLGDGIGYTVITGNRNVASGLFTTYRSATVGISGDGFMARDITFQNTAGAVGHQAVALRASADLVVFERCSFEGYQDTLYALTSRQFYRNCRISGTVDFIFGNAIAVFQNTEIIARVPLPEQQNTYTAQGRKESIDISGFSFQNCTLTGEEGLLNFSVSNPTYLGRPWKAYSRAVFLQSDMGALVNPQGWLPWNASNPFTNTVFYGEYANRGPGSGTSQRVTWLGVHPNLTPDEASQFTVENFISGVTWLSPMQVEYEVGLTQ